MYTNLSIFILSIFTIYAILRTPNVGQGHITILYENGTVLNALPSDPAIADILSTHVPMTESSHIADSSWAWTSIYVLFCVAAVAFVIYEAVKLVKSLDISGTLIILMFFGFFMAIGSKFMQRWSGEEKHSLLRSRMIPTSCVCKEEGSAK